MRAAELTVVVTVVDGRAALRRCLDALESQRDAPTMEVIVPFDPTIGDVEELAERYPAFRFMPLDTPLARNAKANALHEHALFDMRRAAGLRVASAPLVAMLEDRGWPRPDWARSMVRIHARLPHAAVGGAVEYGSEGMLRRAIFLCDFGRYEPPLPPRSAAYLSDVNICYKRSALERIRPVWEVRYQEVQVHSELRRRGDGLVLSDEPRVVQQREPITWWRAIAERVHWGRTFGRVRGAALPRLACLLFLATKPVVPLLLLGRVVYKQVRLGRSARAYLREMPAVLLLTVCWSFGEAVGECEGLVRRR